MPAPDPTRSAVPAPATLSGADPAVTDSLAAPATTTRGTGEGPFAAVPPPVSAQRYELGAEIARGGMGIVYRATDTAFAREVAVKVLLDKYAPTSGTARRFADEARITGQLQHPNIPAVHDLGTLPDGRPFLAMKLIKGDTLDDLLKARTDPSVDRGRFVAAFEQVCQAVAYAHAHNVIHRDLKPANVMVGAFGEVQVMDWGLAKVLGSRSAEESDLEETANPTAIQSLRGSASAFTQAGSVLGTPAFMPPEQAVGAISKVDVRSDVFGLGAILAVILTGKPPFVGSSVETTRVMAAQGNVEECFARLDASGAEPELVSLCKRCLSKKPGDRPADAREVARAVAELRTAADERARQAELDRVKAEGDTAAAELQAVEQWKRRRVQFTLTAAVLLVLVAGVAVSAYFAVHANFQAEEAKVAADGEAAQKVIAVGKADLATKEAKRADDEKTEAKKQADRAEGEKARANEHLRRAEWSVYAGKMLLAQAAFAENNMREAFRHLDDCQWDLRGWEHAHLRWRFDESKQTLKGHASAVQSACFSPDGKRILTGSFDTTAKVWDAEKGTELLALRHEGGVLNVCYSPDGKRAFAWDATDKVLAWSAED